MAGKINDGWKRPRGHSQRDGLADSIQHDLNSACLDTTNAAQMVFDRPLWKAIVSTLPTLEPLSQVSKNEISNYRAYNYVLAMIVVMMVLIMMVMMIMMKAMVMMMTMEKGRR